jgi:hypothetical protein
MKKPKSFWKHIKENFFGSREGSNDQDAEVDMIQSPKSALSNHHQEANPGFLPPIADARAL